MLPKQLRIHAVLIVACIFMILYPLYSDKPDTAKIAQAVPVAEAFLELVDGGRYDECWRSAAVLLQEKISEKDWVDKLSKAHEFSGALVGRERTSASYTTEIDGSPEGEYIMLIYTTHYEKQEELTEYVTVMLDDGQWKVAGYFMQL